MTVFVQFGECGLEHMGDSRLSSGRSADNHVSVTNCHSLKKLNDFHDEWFHNLELPFSQNVSDGFIKESIVDEWNINTREKIIDDTLEEW